VRPSDKWNLHVFVPGGWRRSACSRPPLPAPSGIFLFCAYRIEFTLNLNLAILLACAAIGRHDRLLCPSSEPDQDRAAILRRPSPTWRPPCGGRRR